MIGSNRELPFFARGRDAGWKRSICMGGGRFVEKLDVNLESWHELYSLGIRRNGLPPSRFGVARKYS